MADATSASIVSLHQPKRRLTAAERSKAYRERKKAEAAHATRSLAAAAAKVVTPPAAKDTAPSPTPVADAKGATPSPAPIAAANDATPLSAPITAANDVMPSPPPIAVAKGLTPSRAPIAAAKPVKPSRQIAQWFLIAAALGLGAVGITINGWFARSLGSTESAGWLFLAVGVAADLVALAMPSAAAAAWAARQRLSAVAGWLIWVIAFAFVMTAGIGFASLNITDMAMSRAARATPAVEMARAALADAMAARDRECAGGVGKNCRQREETVNERRRAVDAALQTVAQAADPQTESAARVVAWLSGGMLRPSGDDFAMMRLVLLALLPQLGGLLLLVGRAGR
jgi:hypothetical protein